MASTKCWSAFRNQSTQFGCRRSQILQCPGVTARWCGFWRGQLELLYGSWNMSIILGPAIST